MIVSKEVSTDIVEYLREKKGISIADIAMVMDTSPEFINFVIEKKLQLTSGHIGTYLKNTNSCFWEFALEAIPMNHLSEKAKSRLNLCKTIAYHLEKKKKNK